MADSINPITGYPTRSVDPNSPGAQIVNWGVSQLPFGQFLPRIGGNKNTSGMQNISGYQRTLSSDASPVSGQQGDITAAQNDQRVRLFVRDVDTWIDSSGPLGTLKQTNGMIFPYTPTITYSAGATYAALLLTHANQDNHYYTHTPAVQIQVSGKFSSRDTTEAAYTYAAFHFLRSVTKMRFGREDEDAGQPPPILVFSGWGGMMFKQVPCILTQFSFDFPAEVDYVYHQQLDAWLPVLTTISVTLLVQHTPNQLIGFDWDRFSTGELVKSGGFT